MFHRVRNNAIYDPQFSTNALTGKIISTMYNLQVWTIDTRDRLHL